MQDNCRLHRRDAAARQHIQRRMMRSGAQLSHGIARRQPVFRNARLRGRRLRSQRQQRLIQTLVDVLQSLGVVSGLITSGRLRQAQRRIAQVMAQRGIDLRQRIGTDHVRRQAQKRSQPRQLPLRIGQQPGIRHHQPLPPRSLHASSGHVIRPEPTRHRQRQFIAAVDGRSNFLRVAQRQHITDLQARLFELRNPKIEQAAHPRIFQHQGGRVAEGLLQQSLYTLRKLHQTLRVEHCHRGQYGCIPGRAQRSKQGLVEFNQSAQFPISPRVFRRGAEQLLFAASPYPHGMQASGQCAGAAAMHAQNDGQGSARQRGFDFSFRHPISSHQSLHSRKAMPIERNKHSRSPAAHLEYIGRHTIRSARSALTGKGWPQEYAANADAVCSAGR